MSEKVYTVKTPLGMRSLGGFASEGYTKNFLPESGALKKRKGWRILHSFRDSELKPLEIDGIYEFRGQSKDSLIVRAGGRLYECDFGLEGATLIRDKLPRDVRGQGQMFAGRLWLGGSGGLLYYDGQEVKNAQSDSVAYVPHTTAEIGDTESLNVPVTKESPSLLTGRRINTMRGEKRQAREYRFMLDAPVMYGAPFSLSAEMRVRRDQDTESGPRTTDYVGKRDGEIFGGIVTVSFGCASLVEDGNVALLGVTDEKGRSVTLEDVNLSCRVEGGRWVVLTFNAVAHEVRDNIRVEFCTSEELPPLNAEVFATVEGQGGSVLLFSCADNRLLALYETEGLLYVPENQVKEIGGKTEKISAVLPMADGNVGIYKEKGFYVLCQAEKGLDKSEAYASSDFYGCISPFVASRLGYDCISLCGDGVFYTPPIENAEYRTNRLYPVGNGIGKELSSCSHKDVYGAAATVFDNRYYLFVGGVAYVAVVTGKGDDKYSWWMLDGCPCRFAASIDGRLYMGRDSGDIAVFYEGYKDLDGVLLTERERDFALIDDGGGTVAVFNRGVGAQEGDVACLPEHYCLLGRAVFDSKTGEISILDGRFFSPSGYATLYEGMEILLIDDGGYEIYSGEILRTDMWKSTVYCGNLGLGQDTCLSVYVKRGKETEYTLKTVNRQLFLYLDGSSVHLLSPDVDYVYLKQEREIECLIYTAFTDLDQVSEKSLLSLAVSLSAGNGGTVTVGYETEKNEYSREIKIGTGVDFDSFDFNDVDLSAMAKRRLRISCFERAFDYVRVRICSPVGREISIEGISLIYENYKKI